ncbi:acyltransferase family protein [Methylobacterium sp. NPDC080182]|uniref:acyltransferase family protein n=1 Tax=Methylobacterium sp. NPDC080182 TaxID=3390590 RepID=UPI003D037BF3
MTLSERLFLTKGRPSGFDYMRIGLAAMIVLWHTVIVSYGIEAQRWLILGPSRPIWAMILPMFFALSGFLVSGSLERSRTIVGFLGLRLIRIFPALAVESTIAMMIVGALFTYYPLQKYFTDPGFWSYTLNMIGVVRYYLPGVFTDNPTTQVNAQLWTLPYELYCYILISLFYIIGFYRSEKLILFGCLVMQVLVMITIYTRTQFDEGTVRGPVLVLSFLYGAYLYRVRDRVPYSAPIFFACAIAMVGFLYLPIFNALSALPAAYVTIYLGMRNPTRSAIVSSGDYSYGIFLYGFPIQQAVSAVFPDLRQWWINFLISTPIIISVAYFSWHCIEKRALPLRGPLMKFESWCMSYCGKLLHTCKNSIAFDLKSR